MLRKMRNQGCFDWPHNLRQFVLDFKTIALKANCERHVKLICSYMLDYLENRLCVFNDYKG